MTGGRRLLNLLFASLAAAGVWVVAQWLWPYLELVAPVGALIFLLLVMNIIDGIWFAVRNRRRFAIAASAAQRQSTTSSKVADTTRASAVGLGGTR